MRTTIAVLLVSFAASAAHGFLVTEVESITVPEGNAFATAPTCPAATSLVGGGFATGGFLDATKSYPNLADEQWVVEMYAESGGWNYRSAAICSEEPVAPVAVTDTETIPASSPATVANVVCEFGSIALSGGSSVTGVTFQRPTLVTAPLWRVGLLGFSRLYERADGVQAAPSGWEVAFRNESTNTGANGTAHALCASWSGAQSVVVSATAQPFSTTSAVAECPEGMFAVGGGIDTADRGVVEQIGSGPLIGTQGGYLQLFEAPPGPGGAPPGWYGSLLVYGATPIEFKVAAICVPEPATGGVAAGFALVAWARVRRRR